jgi:hypothetical protein
LEAVDSKNSKKGKERREGEGKASAANELNGAAMQQPIHPKQEEKQKKMQERPAFGSSCLSVDIESAKRGQEQERSRWGLPTS